MAMSFARPDPSSPASVADAAFGTGRRGFDQAEVRDFLRMVAAELGRLQERERFLERELRISQTNPDLDNVRFDDATLTRLLGEETTRVLGTARESAAEIREKAEQNAARLLSEASDEAVRMREEAEIEASRRRSDAASDAEAELAMAKQQGREMVNEARAYRERVLSELARRRELAREQIEQLMHGRVRLTQAFERARIVAADVVAELQPLGEPDEYVNLSPTTGPVPVMVPNARPRDESPDVAAVEVFDADADHSTGGDTTPDIDAIAVVGLDAGTAGADTADADTTVADTDDAETGRQPDAMLVDSDAATIAAADDVHDHDDTHDDSDDGSDDVVVDLFARIRAESVSIAVVPPGVDDADDAPVGRDIETHDTAEHDEVDEQPDGERTDHGEADEGEGADVAESPFERRDAELTPLIVASARKLKRVLADEQNGVLDGLRRNSVARDLDDLLPDRNAHIDRFAAAIDTELRAAATCGASSVDATVTLDVQQMTEVIAVAQTSLGEWLVNPLRERIETVIVDGAGDNDAIVKRIRAIYREWKTQHIDGQLDDVLRVAHGRAVLEALPENAPVCWGVDADHPACADGDDNALAGCVAAGTAFPTGHTFAPSHVGCRCLLVPADR